jgi:hypothetical protein
VPRSVERNSSLPPTNAQRMSREGALSCAVVGIGIGVFVNDGVDVALGEALGVVDAVTVGVAVGVGEAATPPGWSRRRYCPTATAARRTTADAAAAARSGNARERRRSGRSGTTMTSAA